jgi:hypothetical protein
MHVFVLSAEFAARLFVQLDHVLVVIDHAMAGANDGKPNQPNQYQRKRRRPKQDENALACSYGPHSKEK